MGLQAGFHIDIARTPLHGPTVRVDLDACLRLPDGSEHSCRIVEASTGEMALSALAEPCYGDKIFIHSAELGRFEGRVERQSDGGFAIGLDLIVTRRRKLAAQLIWFANRDAFGLPDARRHKRIVPRMPWTTICLQGGKENAAWINDVSCSGISVETSAHASIGDRVSLGVKTAVVGRIFDGGFVAEFDQYFEEGQISDRLRF
ncbi:MULTISPECIES: PilZ domain-containing protein [Methylocystis]|uniref:PilZ domain-containing protein n=1 Tax=Methylocystis TaxID=133 RepID=UPI0019236DDE|nr:MULTISPECIES: PilZ domain-containing protein [Methylocystis]MBL1255227.1 PilZ domain-containing protein [Methylocystis sp. Sn-Cys]